MAVKVFVLGRPGVGKSTAARYMTHYARNHSWDSIHVNDYHILKEMFQKDSAFQKFRPIANGGFDVTDFSVLDTALQKLEENVRQRMNRNKKELIIIEFARDDYRKAFKVFKPDFLQDSYFLFLDAAMDTCIERIHERIAYPQSADDHFVSDEILRDYYRMDNRLYFAFRLEKDYKINKFVQIIYNIDTPRQFAEEIYKFADNIFMIEAPAQRNVLSPQKHVAAIPLSPVPASIRPNA